MPTERFLKLPEEKRRRILQAAWAELARVPAEQLSINKIVQAAGIPRGSFYQYFSGKNDLLDYVLRDFTGGLRQSIRGWLVEDGGDVFTTFERILAHMIELGAKAENFAVYHNVFSHLRLDEREGPEVMCFTPGQMALEFGPYANLTGLRLDAPGQLADFLEMMVVLLRRAVTRAFGDIAGAEAVQRSFSQQLAFIKHGVVKSAPITEGGQ